MWTRYKVNKPEYIKFYWFIIFPRIVETTLRPGFRIPFRSLKKRTKTKSVLTHNVPSVRVDINFLISFWLLPGHNLRTRSPRGLNFVENLVIYKFSLGWGEWVPIPHRRATHPWMCRLHVCCMLEWKNHRACCCPVACNIIFPPDSTRRRGAAIVRSPLIILAASTDDGIPHK